MLVLIFTFKNKQIPEIKGKQSNIIYLCLANETNYQLLVQYVLKFHNSLFSKPAEFSLVITRIAKFLKNDCTHMYWILTSQNFWRSQREQTGYQMNSVCLNSEKLYGNSIGKFFFFFWLRFLKSLSRACKKSVFQIKATSLFILMA